MNNTQKSFYALTIVSLLFQAYGLFGQVMHLIQGNFGTWSNFNFLFSNLSSIFFLIAGIIGVIKFVTNENIYNKWLKAYAIMTSFYFILYLPNKLLMLFGFHPAFKDLGFLAFGIYFLLRSIFALIYFIVCIKHFSKEEKVFTNGSSLKKGSRFIHYLIDSFFIVFTGLNLVYSISYLFGMVSKIAGSWFISYISIFFTLLIYYIISEGIFKQSLGKLVTNHYVAKSDGTKANFRNIVIRTLCRFIPFEAFTYLTSPMMKWHDKFSETDVFEDIQMESTVDYNNEIPNSNFEEEIFDPGNWEE